MASILSSWRGLKPDTLQPRLELTSTWGWKMCWLIGYIWGKNNLCMRAQGTIDCLQEQMVLLFIFCNVSTAFTVWQTGREKKKDKRRMKPWRWQNYFDRIVLSFSASCIPQIKPTGEWLSKMSADTDKSYSVTRLQQLEIAWDIHHPAPFPPSSPPTCSLTLCAASRLWTKPISVRYFIPDATPASMSISCITLSWPSCFWGEYRHGGKAREEKGLEVR